MNTATFVLGFAVVLGVALVAAAAAVSVIHWIHRVRLADNLYSALFTVLGLVFAIEVACACRFLVEKTQAPFFTWSDVLRGGVSGVVVSVIVWPCVARLIYQDREAAIPSHREHLIPVQADG